MINHVDAAGPGTVELWSPDDIREDIPEAADTVREDQIGILFATADGKDGVLLVGTDNEVIDRLEKTIELIRREHAAVYGKPLT